MATETMTEIEEDRPFWPAVRRGFFGRCPNCGKGHVLHSYLKVNDACECCGLDFSYARADDGPAYITILVVGHLMLPGLLAVYIAYQPGPWTLFAIFGISTVVLSLALLPRFKGMLIGIQWAKRMFGF